MLINFDISEENSVVTLVSKKEFLITDKFEKIEFSFVPK